MVFDPPRDGAANMAVDHALAETVEPDAGWLRLYRWVRPTLSLGRNEPAADVYDFARAGRLGIDVVRRPTGGRGVLHDAELTYAVVAPVAAAGRLRAAYAVVHAGLAAGLRALGADARLAAGMATGPPRAGACFDATAGGEVVVGGRKLTGSAQARIGRALLQHGSVLIDGTQATVRRLCRQPAVCGHGTRVHHLARTAGPRALVGGSRDGGCGRARGRTRHRDGRGRAAATGDAADGLA